MLQAEVTLFLPYIIASNASVKGGISAEYEKAEIHCRPTTHRRAKKDHLR